MIASNHIGWKRFFSFRYLRDKISEKGWEYILRRITQAIISLLYIKLYPYVFMPLFYFSKVRFTNFVFWAVGHMGHDPDIFVKEYFLGLRPKFNAVWLVHHKPFKIANEHLLSYWSQYITVIRSPLICKFLWPFTQHRKLVYKVVKKRGSSSSTYAGAADIYRKWGSRPPLLTLSELDRERGWNSLHKLGVPKDAWFVAVHCREAGYDKSLKNYGRKDYYESKSQSNADIINHIPAMKTIVEQGGWCIRIGDPSMKPLPKIEKVIDYVHTKEKSDWMDVFLSASCKFQLAHSGIFSISLAFGVPNAFVNQSFGTLALWRVDDIAIPKLIFSTKEKRLLTFKEIYDTGIADYYYKIYFERANVTVLDNSPEDIMDLTLEMLKQEKGEIVYTDKDEELQEKFKSLMKPHNNGFGGPARIGRDFLRKYEYLLD